MNVLTSSKHRRGTCCVGAAGYCRENDVAMPQCVRHTVQHKTLFRRQLISTPTKTLQQCTPAYFRFYLLFLRDYSMWAWSPTPLRKNKLWGPRVRGFACWMAFLLPSQQSLSTKGKLTSKFMPHYMRLSKWTVSIYITILSFLLTAIFQVDLG